MIAEKDQRQKARCLMKWLDRGTQTCVTGPVVADPGAPSDRE